MLNKSAYAGLTKLIFPPHCAACRALLPYDGEGGEIALCRECRSTWERAKLVRCDTCGEAMIDCRCIPPIVAGTGCLELVKLAAYEPRRREGGGAPGEGAVRSVVNNIKRINSREAFDFLASQLLPPLRRRLGERGIDISDCLITCCPRRSSARREHGFDQSERLARRIASLSGAEYSSLLARRHFSESREQKKLSASERYENVRGTIRPAAGAEKLTGRAVILVDDVVTTGATLSACADILRAGGFSPVFAVCIAAVPLERHVL